METTRLSWSRVLRPVIFASEVKQRHFSPQSLLMIWSDDLHFGHLCVVVLNLSKQKGMKQQPARQLRKEDTGTL